MDPEQALMLLDNTVAQLTLSRRDHERLLMAVSVLRDVVVGKGGGADEESNGPGLVPNSD